MKYWILFFIILILSGCMPKTSESETPSTMVTIPQETFEPTDVLITPTTQIPSTEASFTIKDINPSDRFVSEKYSSFLSDANLVMVMDGKLALYDVKTGLAKTYDQIIIDGLPFSSPDGKHISYMSTNGSDKTLWIFTPSTKKMPQSFPVLSETSWLRWIANDKIALWNYPDSNGCQQYGGFFDLKTGDVAQPKFKTSALDQTICRFFPSINSDGTKVFYPWQIQDLRTGTVKEIRLVDDVTTNPPQYLLDWTNDSISIFSFNENELSYTFDLLTSTINDQSINLYTVELPAFATKSYYWMPPVTGLNLKRLGWDLIDKNTDVSGYGVDPTKGNLPTSFYLIDLETFEAVNYHLDRSVPSKDEMVALAKPVQQGYFSPDGKYLAWTIYSTADYTPPIETQVLDLETGVVVVIKDTEIFGWLIP